MDKAFLIKILIFFTLLNVIISVGIHATIISNAEKVKDSAFEFVEQSCERPVFIDESEGFQFNFTAEGFWNEEQEP